MKTLILLNTIVAVFAYQQSIPSVPTFSSCQRFSPLSLRTQPKKRVAIGRTSPIQVHSQSSDTHEGDYDEKLAKKIVGRKMRVITGYKISSFSYLLLGLTIIAKNKLFNFYYGMGPIIVSTVGWILSDAATNNRLSSDTYKRLNLFLIMSTLFSCIGNILMGGFALERFMTFITIVNSIKGYGYGLKGWELSGGCAKEDLLNGMKQSLQICTKAPNFSSAGYLAMFSCVGALFAQNFKALVSLILSNSKSFMIGTRMYRLSKILMLGAICFTLKDAADRGRLEGTTFITLNYLTSATFLAMSLYLGNIKASWIGFISACFSAFSLFNGISSTLKKKTK